MLTTNPEELLKNHEAIAEEFRAQLRAKSAESESDSSPSLTWQYIKNEDRAEANWGKTTWLLSCSQRDDGRELLPKDEDGRARLIIVTQENGTHVGFAHRYYATVEVDNAKSIAFKSVDETNVFEEVIAHVLKSAAK